MRDKIAVLYSGGIDSTVLAYHLAKTGSLHLLIYVDYGNRSTPTNVRNLELLASLLHVEYVVLKLDYAHLVPTAPMFQENYTPKDSRHRDDLMEGGSLRDDKDFGFLDARNHMFMMWASVNAASMGCNRLATGFQSNTCELGMNTEQHLTRSRDGCRQVIKTVNEAIFSGFRKPFLVTAPFESFTKQEVVNLGRSLGVRFDRTQSCEYAVPCGRCSQCVEREEVLADG